MNKLFIIGNGFDLAHGLKTSYSDFILWYLKKAVNDLQAKEVYKDELMLVKLKRKDLFNSVETIQDFISLQQRTIIHV